VQYRDRRLLISEFVQSVLAPAGAPAAAIHSLWQLMLWTTAIVFALVMVFLVLAIVRRHSSSPQSLTRGVTTAVTITVFVLVGLLVASVVTDRTVTAHASNAVTVDVSGHQWWWEVEYEHSVPAERFVTANEIHVPVGRPVVLKAQSRDVIHSFWAPNLQGKRDLIPGYVTAIWIQADRPGVFRGQCAEFCGKQHAHMAFDVIAQPEAEFEQWRAHMRENAQEPQSDEERRGRDIFMRDRCSSCHTIRGTEAGGLVGPDLTHIAARQTIAAGTLPNTPDHLGDWIRDSQSIKPYNQMPPASYSRDDLDALVAYLASLR
jgi:cytochrome c oxidase subunit 2